MEAPPRRRVAAVAVTSPGAAGAATAAQEQLSGNACPPAQDKGLTAQSLQEYARLKKLERERKREEEAARLRAAKLAAVAQRSSEPSAAVTSNQGTTQLGRGRAMQARSGGSENRMVRPVSSNSSGSSSGVVAAGSSWRIHTGTERHSISSAGVSGAANTAAAVPAGETAVQAPSGQTDQSEAAAYPATRLQCVPRVPLQNGSAAGAAGGGQKSSRCTSSSGWSPRKSARPQAPGAMQAAAGLPKPARAVSLQQPPQPQRHAVSSRAGSLSARSATGSMPARSHTGALQPQGPALPAAAERPQPHLLPPPVPGGATAEDAELDSAELEARRTQRLIDWSALLVQASATAAAERVLLGPAALPDSQPLTAEELPLSFGWQAPSNPAARAGAARQQVAAALAALEHQRQAKLALLAAAEQAGGSSLSAVERQLLQAEAAADLQAQSLLAHWGMQVACEARQGQAGVAEA